MVETFNLGNPELIVDPIVEELAGINQTAALTNEILLELLSEMQLYMGAIFTAVMMIIVFFIGKWLFSSIFEKTNRRRY